MGLEDQGITLHCNSDFKTKQLKYRKLIWPCEKCADSPLVNQLSISSRCALEGQLVA